MYQRPEQEYKSNFFRINVTFSLLLLNEQEFLFVHRVSRQSLNLIPNGLPCVERECRDIHVSFMDTLDIRRIALCRATINDIKVNEMFTECNSPELTQIRSSCVFEVRLF